MSTQKEGKIKTVNIQTLQQRALLTRHQISQYFMVFNVYKEISSFIDSKWRYILYNIVIEWNMQGVSISLFPGVTLLTLFAPLYAQVFACNSSDLQINYDTLNCCSSCTQQPITKCIRILFMFIGTCMCYHYDANQLTIINYTVLANIQKSF